LDEIEVVVVRVLCLGHLKNLRNNEPDHQRVESGEGEERREGEYLTSEKFMRLPVGRFCPNCLCVGFGWVVFGVMRTGCVGPENGGGTGWFPEEGRRSIGAESGVGLLMGWLGEEGGCDFCGVE
jgi:hypothetical protein